MRGELALYQTHRVFGVLTFIIVQQIWKAILYATHWSYAKAQAKQILKPVKQYITHTPNGVMMVRLS